MRSTPYLLAALSLTTAVAACSDSSATDNSDTTSTGGGGQGEGGANPSTGGTGPGGSGAGGEGTAPIDGPADEWAWRPIEGTKCGNGTPAGVGVNLHDDSTMMIIWVSGGGACWDDEMCNGASPASIHIHEELTEAVVAPEYPGLDRSDPNNPFAAATVAYVPYCTGDLHWGDATGEYSGGNIEHRGASNMRTFLERLRATRPNTQQIFFYGGSAGGYGVTLHLGTAKEVFGDDVEVHALADSSPMVQPLGDRYDLMKQNWNIQFPSGCEGCEDDMGFIVDTLAERYPTSRYGALIYGSDAVISMYLGFGEGQLAPAVEELRAVHYDPYPETKYFVYAAGTGHGMVADQTPEATAPDGTTPLLFFLQWLTDDPAWESHAF
ncbi:MAG: hypothetical protein HOW73_24260 [Polyangiaceae bacterium]|nr:hypothetical protein [Polyangiaceae bacterium]